MSRQRSLPEANHVVPVSPHEAFKRVCYAFGVAELADRLTMKRGTLYNKCDSDVEGYHQPTLRDVIAVTRETGDLRVIHSLNRLFQQASYPAAPPEVCSDAALLELLLRVGQDHGALCSAVHRALEDGKFTSAELEQIRGEGFDLISQVLAFIQRLEGLVDA